MIVLLCLDSPRTELDLVPGTSPSRRSPFRFDDVSGVCASKHVDMLRFYDRSLHRCFILNQLCGETLLVWH